MYYYYYWGFVYDLANRKLPVELVCTSDDPLTYYEARSWYLASLIDYLEFNF